MIDSDELKKRVESVLFASGNKLAFDEIVRIISKGRDIDAKDVKQILKDIAKELDDAESSLMLIEEGDEWRMTVRERYIPYVKEVVSQLEFSKSVMETLAVIAYKAPVLQSEVIHIRTNKAYDHLSELESMGYISRKKHGRTKEITLAPKFFQYFDLPKERLEAHFAHLKKQEEAVAATENFLKEQKRLLRERKKEIKDTEEKQQKEFDELNDALDKDTTQKLQVYESLAVMPVKEPLPSQVEKVKDAFGNLEVVNVPKHENQKPAVIVNPPVEIEDIVSEKENFQGPGLLTEKSKEIDEQIEKRRAQIAGDKPDIKKEESDEFPGSEQLLEDSNEDTKSKEQSQDEFHNQDGSVDELISDSKEVYSSSDSKESNKPNSSNEIKTSEDAIEKTAIEDKKEDSS